MITFRLHPVYSNWNFPAAVFTININHIRHPPLVLNILYLMSQTVRSVYHLDRLLPYNTYLLLIPIPEQLYVIRDILLDQD